MEGSRIIGVTTNPKHRMDDYGKRQVEMKRHSSVYLPPGAPTKLQRLEMRLVLLKIIRLSQK
jgi:hypothetical protein